MQGFNPTSHENIVIDQASKEVLNSHLGKTNIMDHDTFVDLITMTMQELKEMILPLCGKNALHNLVIYQQMGGSFNTNVFSNDGIHMLKSIEYASPIQTYIVNYVKYISDKVELASADGTSTAIYLAAEAICKGFKLTNAIRNKTIEFNNGNLAEVTVFDREVEEYNAISRTNRSTIPHIVRVALSGKLYSIKPDKQMYVSPHSIKYIGPGVLSDKSYKKVIAEFTTQLNDEFISLMCELNEINIDLNEVSDKLRDLLIYKLAYTTSHGLSDLADYAVTIFTNMPPELYDMATYIREGIETDTPLSIEYKEYDAALTILPTVSTDYNYNLFTEVKHDGADILVIPEVTKVSWIKEIIEKHQEEDNHLFVLIKHLNPTDEVALGNAIDPLKTSLLIHTNHSAGMLTNPIELMALLATAGKTYVTPKDMASLQGCIIKDVDCHIVMGNTLRINCLYECDGYMHKYYKSEDHPYYSKLVEEIGGKISQLKASHNASNTEKEIDEFMRIFRSMVCFRLPIIVVGGTTTENLAYRNIVEDVNGVVSVALREGVILDAIPKLCNMVKKYEVLATLLHSSLVKFKNEMYDEKDINVAVLPFSALLEYTGIPGKHHSLSQTAMTEDEFVSFIKEYYELTTVQSFKSVHETIRRLHETIPKLITTNNVIVPHSVVNN